MTRICSRCGNVNDEAVKFCTNCGDPLDPPVVQPVTSVTQRPSQVSSGPTPGQNSPVGIIAIAAVAVIVILAVLFFLQASGTFRIFPSTLPSVTPQATPTVLSYAIVPTVLPETTIPIAVGSTATTITESPQIPPAVTKAPVCPSDRRACDAICTDIMTDRSNCGACGVPCSSSQTCLQGYCMAPCPTDQVSCFDGCHNLSYDAQNCGACGNSCPVGLACNKSLCGPTLPTTIPTYAG